MGFVSYLLIAVGLLIYKTIDVQPHFHYEKICIVAFSMLWPLALLSWSVTGFSILIIDTVQEIIRKNENG